MNNEGGSKALCQRYRQHKKYESNIDDAVFSGKELYGTFKKV